MKNTKAISWLLIATILISTINYVSGCSKYKLNGNGISNVIVNDIEKVEADSLWFDYSEKELEFVDNPAKYLYYYIDTFYPIKDGYVALFVGVTSDTYEPIGKILMYDQDLNLTDTLEILPDMLGAKEGSSINVSNLTVIDGNPCALVNSYYFDENTYESESKCFLFDIDTQELANIDYLKEKVADGGSIDSFGASREGYVYVTVSKTGEKSSFDIIFGKDGSFVKSFDVSQTIGREDVWGCHFMSEEDGILYFECYGDNYTQYLEIDTTNFTTKVNDTYEHYEGYVNKFIDSTFENDGKLYSIIWDGILCDGELVMPFNSTYVNRSNLLHAQLLWASDDRFVVLSKIYSIWAGDTFKKYNAYIFDRTESNPNAGKTILTAGYVTTVSDYMPEYVAEAISVFNQSNDNYFVKSVGYEFKTDEHEGDTSDFYQFYKGKSSQVANIAIDISCGEGPDILFDSFSFVQLNSEQYLYDLSDILNEIDVEIFNNVIEASRTDGKLYQMPLSFCMDGIFAQRWMVKGEAGFTFDEYVEYVDKTCNGTNPIPVDRKTFFDICLSSMSDEFFDEEGNLSFQNDAFYELAQYCLSNVPEEIVYVEPTVGDVIDWDNVIYSYTSLYSIDTYLHLLAYGKSSVGYYGVPSLDGRGPSIGVEGSIAISAAACDYDGAKEFLKVFFSSDSNRIFKEALCNPIVVSASDMISKQKVDLNNKNYDSDLEWNTEAELAKMHIVRFDYDVIDDYNKLIRNASTIGLMDPVIQLIVMEEIPAYFAGQKSIEDVAAIIEDRAQTVIDERS